MFVRHLMSQDIECSCRRFRGGGAGRRVLQHLGLSVDVPSSNGVEFDGGGVLRGEGELFCRARTEWL